MPWASHHCTCPGAPSADGSVVTFDTRLNRLGLHLRSKTSEQTHIRQDDWLVWRNTNYPEPPEPPPNTIMYQLVQLEHTTALKQHCGDSSGNTRLQHRWTAKEIVLRNDTNYEHFLKERLNSILCGLLRCILEMDLKCLRMPKTNPTVTKSLPIVAIHLGKADHKTWDREGVLTTILIACHGNSPVWSKCCSR